MAIIKMKDVVVSKIKNADEVYNQNIAIIKEYFQNKVWELSEVSLSNMINFINNIEDIIYTNGKLTTDAIKDYTIFKNEDFELKYSFSGSYLSMQVYNVPDELGESYAICSAIKGGKTHHDLTNNEFGVYHRGKLILNTLFSSPSYQANYPHDGSNCFRSLEVTQ